MSAVGRMVTSVALLAAVSGVLAGCGGGSKVTSPISGRTSTPGSTFAPADTSTPGNTSTGGTAATAPVSRPTAVETNIGGDIPDSQAFVPYRDARGLFTVTVPEGWAQTSVSGSTLFSDKYNSIRIESRAVASAPTVDSVRTKDLPAVRTLARGFTPGPVTSVNRTAGPSILLTYRADSVANPVTGKVALEAVERYAFWRKGNEVILTLSAPVGSDNVDPWRKVTDSFAWTNR